jgi:glycosyltransferase involved in cell wall biosynthesis
LLRGAIASALASGADEVVVVRPYDEPLPDLAGRFRDVRTGEATTGGKHADGVEAARGDVVAFLDDDDEWKPEKVAVLRERFGAAESLVLLNHAYDVVDEAGRFLHPGRPALGRWTLSSNLALRRAWAAPRTALLREAGWEADEAWVFLADLESPNGIEVLDRPLTRWRYHADNISRAHRTTATEFRTTYSRLFPRWVRAEDAMLRYARDRGAPESSPVVAVRRRRRAVFQFLADLENDRAPRAAARGLLRGREGDRGVRALAYLTLISPGSARYALFRFNRFH